MTTMYLIGDGRLGPVSTGAASTSGLLLEASLCAASFELQPARAERTTASVIAIRMVHAPSKQRARDKCSKRGVVRRHLHTDRIETARSCRQWRERSPA